MTVPFNGPAARVFLGRQLDLLSAGQLLNTSTYHVESPVDSADVAIKVSPLEESGLITAVGVARYASGRVVGEVHSQSASLFGSLKKHSHADILCQDFEMRASGLFLPDDKVPEESPTQLVQLNGLVRAVDMISMLHNFDLGCDIRYSKPARERARSLDTSRNRALRLFKNPALRVALNEQIN